MVIDSWWTKYSLPSIYVGVSFLKNSAYFKPPKKYVVFVCKTEERIFTHVKLWWNVWKSGRMWDNSLWQGTNCPRHCRRLNLLGFHQINISRTSLVIETKIPTHFYNGSDPFRIVGRKRASNSPRGAGAKLRPGWEAMGCTKLKGLCPPSGKRPSIPWIKKGKTGHGNQDSSVCDLGGLCVTGKSRLFLLTVAFPGPSIVLGT